MLYSLNEDYKKDLNAYVDGLAREVIKYDSSKFLKRLLKEGQKYSNLYRFLNSNNKNFEEKEIGDFDNLFEKNIGDIFETRLCSTTKAKITHAFLSKLKIDLQCELDTVLIFKNTLGLSLDYSLLRNKSFSYQDEVLTAGKFKIIKKGFSPSIKMNYLICIPVDQSKSEFFNILKKQYIANMDPDNYDKDLYEDRRDPYLYYKGHKEDIMNDDPPVNVEKLIKFLLIDLYSRYHNDLKIKEICKDLSLLLKQYTSIYFDTSVDKWINFQNKIVSKLKKEFASEEKLKDYKSDFNIIANKIDKRVEFTKKYSIKK